MRLRNISCQFELEVREVIQSGAEGVAYKRLALAEENLGLVANFLLMNSLSWSFLGLKNEAYLNEARKCVYKVLIYLEEIVTSYIDVPFSTNGPWQDLLNGFQVQVDNYRLWNFRVNSNWGNVFYQKA